MKLNTLIICMLLLVSQTAFGYEIETTQNGAEMKWNSSNIPVNWYLHNDGAPGIDFLTTRVTMSNSFQTWEDVDCSYLDFEYKGTSSATASDVGTTNPDYKNVMIWINESEWDSTWTDAFAVTVPLFYQQTGEIIDADILFSKRFTWSVDVNGEEGKADLQSIATHEIGHLLGLDHPDNSDATMYWSALEGEIHKRTLAADDIQGICYLYPLAGMDGSSCSTDADCTGSRSCIYHTNSYGNICSSPCKCNIECSGDLECISNQCLPKESEIGGLGSECSTTIPCATSEMICLNNFCSIFCDSNSDCPDTWTCVDLQVPSGSAPQKGCYTANPSQGNTSTDDAAITSFTTNPASPALPKQSIALSGTADGSGTLEYRFSVHQIGSDWTILKGYSTLQQTYWIPEQAGNYELKMEVKHQDEVECTEDVAMLSYVISGDTDVDGDSSSVDGDSEEDGGSGCISPENSFSATFLLFALMALFLRRKTMRL